ncbi:MAG TPA: PAC2 family protein [Chloroflexota bacterium]|jgi:proteasome assembly chaperone (PAC2) family protein
MPLVLGEPPGGLRQPVLLAGFGGWGDAGSAASIALRHVLGDPAPPASAMLDPSACYDFTVARPLSTRSPDGRRWSLEYPKVAFYPMQLPRAERDLLLLIGPEPHFRWPELAPAIINYARAAGVQSMLTLGAYVGPVTHHVAPVVRRTLDPSLSKRLRDLDLQDTDYEGPTAFVTALLHAAAAGGLSAVSLWVATPPYLQAGNPVAALALLEASNKVTQLPFEIERLREVADTFLHDVEAALEEHPELAEQLKEMLEEEREEQDEAEDEAFESRGRAHWRGPDPDRPPPDSPPGLPSGKALVEAVEKYLQQRKDSDEPPPPAAGPAV